MDAGIAETAAPTTLDDLFAKELWTQQEVQALYQRIYASPMGVEKFAALAGRMLAENAAPSGAAAVKAGIAQYMLGRFEDAVKNLAAGTDNKDRRWYQALCYRDLAQYEKAIEEFSRAADRGWADSEVKIAVAECQVLSGNVEAAAAAVAKLASQASASEYQVLRGMVLQAQGDPEKAEEAFGEALDLDAGNTAAAFRLAFLYDIEGDEDQAIELYQQCLRTPPVNTNALINLAVLFEDEGRWDQAERCLRTVLSVQPNHARAKLYLKDVECSKDMYYDEDLERRTVQRNAVMDIPVTDFELSVRARNCLKKMDIHNLGDLMRVTEADLLGSKNFGETSLAEIKAMLAQKGLQLGQDVEIKPTVTTDTTDQGAVVANEGVLATPVADLELSVRSRKALGRLRVATLGELASKTEADLLSCKNFGQTSLNEIKQRLSEYGLELRHR
jgi:DNA-directed RNA polymerase subunit alpha